MSTRKSEKLKKCYKAGIVGCGRIGSTFDLDPLRKYVATHAGAYSKLPFVDLVCACDIDEGKLRAFGNLWKVKKLYLDLDEMLAK